MIDAIIGYDNLSIQDYDLLSTGKDYRSYNGTIASKIGLYEAIILNQINYWVNVNKDKENNERYYHNKMFWMYMTLDGWHEQFDYISKKTIQRALKKLKDNNLIYVGNFNHKSFDRTMWYCVNYDTVRSILYPKQESSENRTESHMDSQSISYGLSDQIHLDSRTSPIPKNNNTKNTSEITKELCIDDAPRIDDLGIYMFHVRRTVMNSERITSKDEVIEAMEYFFRQYTVHKGESHIKLKKETIESIGEKLDTFADDLKDMIDRYFSTDFREDYCSLPHFASDNILELKAYETGALGPALQLSYA